MTIKSILALLTVIISLYSCRKVIDIKLRDSDIKYVVEGVITNEPGVCKVYLSQSKNFNADNQFQGLSGAIIKVKDNDREFSLVETHPGTYETTLVNGTPGHIYQLSVAINNQLFTATSIMPQPVLMDSLYVSRGPFGQFMFATIAYTDVAGIPGRYRFVQYVNGVKEPVIFWRNDDFTDGQRVIVQLDVSAEPKEDPRNIKSGDEVTVEMLCLDEPVYKYWYSLRTGGGDGSGNTAAPANPLSNIKGGALGYFSAHTIDRKKTIAP